MCKGMMTQRQEIEQEIERKLKDCLRKIRQNGEIVTPIVRINMEQLWVANKKYFERNGFYFENEVCMEDEQIKYFARMKIMWDGDIASRIRMRIYDARQYYMMDQRQQLEAAFAKAVIYSNNPKEARVQVDMENILFENKTYFEEKGFFFKMDTIQVKDKVKYYAWMQKA